ncbi:hypothetical protein E4U55_005773 [Claviceps digitariae]|nr:hypothetical protein E4U55_005773 [Claviceps digitariae]
MPYVSKHLLLGLGSRPRRQEVVEHTILWSISFALCLARFGQATTSGGHLVNCWCLPPFLGAHPFEVGGLASSGGPPYPCKDKHHFAAHERAQKQREDSTLGETELNGSRTMMLLGTRARCSPAPWTLTHRFSQMPVQLVHLVYLAALLRHSPD